MSKRKIMSKEDCLLYGKRLRYLRESRGYTIRQLAAQIGMTYQNISKYERGIAEIRLSLLLKILECLDYGLNDFFQMELGNNLTVEEGNLIYLMRLKNIDLGQYIKIFE